MNESETKSWRSEQIQQRLQKSPNDLISRIAKLEEKTKSYEQVQYQFQFLEAKIEELINLNEEQKPLQAMSEKLHLLESKINQLEYKYDKVFQELQQRLQDYLKGQASKTPQIDNIEHDLANIFEVKVIKQNKQEQIVKQHSEILGKNGSRIKAMQEEQTKTSERKDGHLKKNLTSLDNNASLLNIKYQPVDLEDFKPKEFSIQNKFHSINPVGSKIHTRGKQNVSSEQNVTNGGNTEQKFDQTKKFIDQEISRRILEEKNKRLHQKSLSPHVGNKSMQLNNYRSNYK